MKDDSDSEETDETEFEDESEGEIEEEDDEKIELNDCEHTLPRHLTCIDHSLELVTGKVIDNDFKGTIIGTTLLKTRKLISSVI